MPRQILHLDLDAFFCAVEERENPRLRGKPCAVGARPEERGVVASCSYAARRFGIRSAMPMAHAVKQCPGLLIVPPRHQMYRAVSQEVMARLRLMTALVEQISIDEAFLDVSDLEESGAVLAHRLQATINQELGLPCSLGVASNKLVAKIANNVGKASAGKGHPPNAIKVVPAGMEAAFLAPLPVEELWGVGPKTAERLGRLGIQTIGGLAQWPESGLMKIFGKTGLDLALRSRGIDDRPVVTEHPTKSISQETTFVEDLQDGATLRHTLRHLCEQVSADLHSNGLSGTTIKLKIRWSDFTTLTRQTTLDCPTSSSHKIHEAALELFEKIGHLSRRIRLIGVGVSGFDPSPGYQLKLWDHDIAKIEHLQAALEQTRRRSTE